MVILSIIGGMLLTIGIAVLVVKLVKGLQLARRSRSLSANPKVTHPLVSQLSKFRERLQKKRDALKRLNDIVRANPQDRNLRSRIKELSESIAKDEEWISAIESDDG